MKTFAFIFFCMIGFCGFVRLMALFCAFNDTPPRKASDDAQEAR